MGGMHAKIPHEIRGPALNFPGLAGRSVGWFRTDFSMGLQFMAIGHINLGVKTQSTGTFNSYEVAIQAEKKRERERERERTPCRRQTPSICRLGFQSKIPSVQ